MTFQAWQELYRAALLELNTAELKLRIDTAEVAIHQRLRELEMSDASAGDEHHALADALRGLRTLARTECPSPSSFAANAPAPGIAS